jgi:hypothetical protein
VSKTKNIEIDRYLGLSSDTKPSSPKTGSTFLETDTSHLFVYSGSAWVAAVTANSNSGQANGGLGNAGVLGYDTAAGWAPMPLSSGGVLVQPKGATPHHLAALGNSDALKSGAGVLASVTINTKGATANVLTLYDSLTHGTGTTLAVIDTTSAVTTLLYNVAFSTGLSASLATGTAADVTISCY